MFFFADQTDEIFLVGGSVNAVHCWMSNALGLANFRSVVFLWNVSRAPTRPAFQLTLAVAPLEKVQSAHVFVNAALPGLQPAVSSHFLLLVPTAEQLSKWVILALHTPLPVKAETERCCRWDCLCADSVASSRPLLWIRLSLQGTSALTAAPLPLCL